MNINVKDEINIDQILSIYDNINSVSNYTYENENNNRDKDISKLSNEEFEIVISKYDDRLL